MTNPVRIDVTGLVCAPEILPFLRRMHEQSGFPYCWPTPENKWSGKGTRGCLYDIGRDCSGAVSDALENAGLVLPEGRAMWSADRYYRAAKAEGRVVERPEIGDLVVYVAPSDTAVHIEAITASGKLIGAIGGDATCVTPEVSLKRGAMVQFREHPYPEAHGRAVFIRNPLRAV